MKQTTKISGLFSVCLVAALVPVGTTSALSCIAPIEYIPTLVEANEDVRIFVGEITDTSTTEGIVTHLDVSVTEALKGNTNKDTTVQYEHDETWGYLCTNAPGEAGTTEAFITRPSDDTVPYVTYSFGVDTELYAALTKAVANTDIEGDIIYPEEPEETSVTEAEERRLVLIQIVKLLQQLLSQSK